MDLMNGLVWLMGGGCIMAASWLLERFGWYQALASKIKELVFFLVSLVLGIGAYLVTVYVPATSIEAMTPYFAIIAMVFSYVFLGKGFHLVDRG